MSPSQFLPGVMRCMGDRMETRLSPAAYPVAAQKEALLSSTA